MHNFNKVPYIGNFYSMDNVEFVVRPKKFAILVLFFGVVSSLNCWALPISLTAVNVNGDRMVVDPNRGVTWADIRPYDISPDFYSNSWGLVDHNFADSLNARNYGGYSDWRAASNDGGGFTIPVSGINIPLPGGDIPYLFIYSLGNTYGSPVTNFGPFTRIGQGGYIGPFWLCDGCMKDYVFDTATGKNYLSGFDHSGVDLSYASVIAVRSGLVPIPVFEPDLAILLGSGLVVFFFVRKYKSV